MQLFNPERYFVTLVDFCQLCGSQTGGKLASQICDPDGRVLFSGRPRTPAG